MQRLSFSGFEYYGYANAYLHLSNRGFFLPLSFFNIQLVFIESLVGMSLKLTIIKNSCFIFITALSTFQRGFPLCLFSPLHFLLKFFCFKRIHLVWLMYLSVHVIFHDMKSRLIFLIMPDANNIMHDK